MNWMRRFHTNSTHRATVFLLYPVDNLDQNKDICGREKVEGFPTLILYQDGAKMLEYQAARTLEGFKQFLKPDPVRAFTVLNK